MSLLHNLSSDLLSTPSFILQGVAVENPALEVAQKRKTMQHRVELDSGLQGVRVRGLSR